MFNYNHFEEPGTSTQMPDFTEAEAQKESKKRQTNDSALYFTNLADTNIVDQAQKLFYNSKEREQSSCKTEEITSTTTKTILTQPTNSYKVDNQISSMAGSVVATREGDSGIASTSSSSIFDASGLSTQPDHSTHNFSSTTVDAADTNSLSANKQATDYICADCICCATANDADIMELCAHLCFCIACLQGCDCADCSGCDCSGCS